ncbi:O-antigen ligase [Phaeobacter sp. 11ANDIMAR09]|uniref:O-antigen ligase family protein n=1 Tax=Phaeobacter sp. 11ANDIMAR09 TaxID=1225647 RepID=UPI0012ED7A7C|nr:O-antigen ligase family protein [Phaeobacter sp. 11ANDIMAR09]
MAQAYVAVVVATLFFTIPEALTGIHILHDSISGAFGGARAPFIEPRMGIERTFGPFDHPILYGVFCASAFSLAYFVVAERRFSNLRGMAKVFGVGLATFMSASGGPYLVLMMQGFVALWERAFSRVQGRWAALFSLMALAYIAIDLFSTKTPFHVFVNNFTFSKQSAYNRILLFEYGTAEVARHPVFGIGLGDWERPAWMSDSMDNFWLVTAVRYGLPAFFLLVAMLLGLIWAAGQRKSLPTEWRRARHAWAFTLFGISVAAATVHLWNALFVLFFFLIGAGAWLQDARPGKTRLPLHTPPAVSRVRPQRLL